jgi:NTP pyrophosphatase (non-canonical NTP hydrolase)
MSNVAMLRRRSTQAALKDVLTERARQLDRWGEQTKSACQWLAVLGEEFGEVCLAINDVEGLDRIREELVQVAAVAVAWIEDVDNFTARRVA